MTTQLLPLLDSADVARILHKPRGTLDQWASKGIGPRFIKIGGQRRYHQADLEAWLRSLPTGGGDAAA